MTSTAFRDAEWQIPKDALVLIVLVSSVLGMCLCWGVPRALITWIPWGGHPSIVTTFTEFPLPAPGAAPLYITARPDQAF